MTEQEYLDKAHRILMDTLMEFDRVCKKYNLRYYLICGSLLGAIRHKELIPWDDDVDVAMPRRDFDELKKHVMQEWNNKNYKFVDYNDMGKGVFLDFMTRLVNMKEEIPVNIFQKMRGKGRKDIDNHLPIDIYVMDNAYTDEKKQKRRVKIIQGIYGLAMGHRAYINYDEYKTESIGRQRQIRFLTACGKCIPLSLIFFFYEKIRKGAPDAKSNAYYESNGWIYCIDWRFPKEWFGKGVEVDLYDKKIMAPENYEEFLKMHYWDYMQLPPEDKRKPTHAVWASGVFQE